MKKRWNFKYIDLNLKETKINNYYVIYLRFKSN